MGTSQCQNCHCQNCHSLAAQVAVCMTCHLQVLAIILCNISVLCLHVDRGKSFHYAAFSCDRAHGMINREEMFSLDYGSQGCRPWLLALFLYPGISQSIVVGNWWESRVHWIVAREQRKRGKGTWDTDIFFISIFLKSQPPSGRPTFGWD